MFVYMLQLELHYTCMFVYMLQLELHYTCIFVYMLQWHACDLIVPVFLNEAERNALCVYAHVTDE
jgi:hypothetical protein